MAPFRSSVTRIGWLLTIFPSSWFFHVLSFSLEFDGLENEQSLQSSHSSDRYLVGLMWAMN
jgi:hypothetical protein